MNRAHPRKTQQGQKLTNDDVSGSSAITNLADIVISVEKPDLSITKNRDFGILDHIECRYDPTNRRIYQTSTGDTTVYSWDHTGIQIPEDQACMHPEFQFQDSCPEELLKLPY